MYVIWRFMFVPINVPELVVLKDHVCDMKIHVCTNKCSRVSGSQGSCMWYEDSCLYNKCSRVSGSQGSCMWYEDSCLYQ